MTLKQTVLASLTFSLTKATGGPGGNTQRQGELL